MDTVQPPSVLEKRIALLPGGRDRHGGAIIVFPSHGDFVEFSYSDVVSVLSYLSQIPEENVRARGYTLVIDMRHAWIRYLKTVLKAIQHVLYGKVRQTIIVKPEQFLEKQRIIIDLKLEVYEFKIFLVSLHKLSRHLDVGQLPTTFGGALQYDHKKWLDLRARYESFLREAAAILKHMDGQHGQSGPTLLAVDTSVSKHSSNDSLDFSSGVSPGGLRVPQEFIMRGQKLLNDLRGDELLLESGSSKLPRNPDIQMWAQRVEAVLRQVRGKEDTAKSVYEKDKAQREHTEKVVYEQFLMGVSNVSDWLLGPGEKWLLTLHEIGESSDEAEQLKRDHEQLKIKAREIEDQTAELRSIADELLALSHPQSTEIQRKRDYLDKITKAFIHRVERQNDVIRMSVRFHNLIDEFTAKLDDMLENLCSEVSANDVPSTQSAIDALDVRISSIDKAYDEVMADSKHFLDFLNSREQNTLGYEVTRDYLPGLIHVRHMIADLQDRRQRSQELADVRRLKLQQMLQLFTCENDAVQAIKWLHDLCDTLLTQHAKLGTNSDEASSIRRDHQKLEQTARSTYEYGRQLIQISSVLRRSLRFEMAQNFDLSHRLEEAWSRFCRGLSERVSRVNLTQAFYHTIKQVNERLEHLCARVGDELEQQKSPTSPRAVDQRRDPYENVLERSKNTAVLRRYENQRRDLIGDVGELRHMAEALVARIEHPVDSKELAHVNRSAIDDIRFHFNQKPADPVRFAKAETSKKRVTHEIVVEHVPIHSPPTARKSLRLHSAFVRECRQSTDWVFLRVDEMQPSMLDVGNNMEEALALQAQHTELMQKLQAKQTNIEELLSKADQMVSAQPEPEAAVYEAMADSLGAAWKELSHQLQLRAILLEQAVNFFAAVQKHKEQMDHIESYLRNLPKAESMETVKQISKKHDQMRLELLDAAVDVMTFGQLTIEKLREIGAFVDNEKRPRQALDACAKIEDIMLRINDRRKRLELSWDDRKSQLDLSQQACQLIAELQQIEDWINRNGDTLHRQKDLGDSETTAEFLLREHEQLLTDAKRMQDKANRLYPMAEQLVSIGYDDGGQLLQRCTNVKRRFDDLLHQAELRRQLLLAAVSFFRAAQSTIMRLDDLESEIKSLSLSRHSDTMARRHAELASRVQETAQPALAQGRSLLQRVGTTEPGAQGVAHKLAELERHVAGLDGLCTAHKAEALARSQKYQDFLQQYTTLHTWLVNVGEAFLYSYRDMGTTLPTVNEFLDRHRQIASDIAHKEPDVLRFLQWAREVQGMPGDPDYEDMKRKADDIRTRWERLKKAIDTRLDLTNIYHQFHRQAMQYAADMDTFEAMVRTSRDDPSSQRQLDLMWASLGQGYDQLKQQGEKFLVQSRVVINDPGLDVRTAQLCVETLLENFATRQRAARDVWTDWQTKQAKDKDFQESWNAFMKECRRYIHYISELKGDASLAFTHFEHPPAVVAERQERALQDFVPKARQAQREVEQLLRKAETLGVQGDTRGEKEKIVNELLQTHQEFQQTVTQFEVLTSMTVTFFKNLQQVDEWIERVHQKFQPDRLPRHDVSQMEQLVQEYQAATQTVEQLIRFARTEGQQIVQKARQPDVAPEIRRECEKIPSLIEERATKWDRISSEQQQQLEQHSHISKFEREIVEIFETIETLTRQVRDLKSRLGDSPQQAQAAAREFRDVERRVNQTDVRVRSLVTTAETLLSGPYRGNQTLRQRTDELKKRWTDFRRELDDLNQKLVASTTYWSLVEETEEWIRETTERIVDVGKKVTEVKTSEDANQLMGQLEKYMKPKQAEQESRMREMEKQAKVLYAEEAEHKLQRQKKKYKEIVDSFVLVSDQLFSLAETYRTEEIRQREIREQQLAQKPPPVPPRFIQTLRENEVTEGSKVEFVCQVTGYPEPEVRWFKDGVPIENNPDYETSKTTHGVCVMKIEETFTEDSAIYTCRANNEAGTTETSARLTVKESPQVRMQPPIFTKKLESTTVEETTTHTFECHVTGEPTPVVSWYKNEQCIDHTPDYHTTFNNGVCRMRIEETMTEDEARYTCRATNAAGDAATSAKLTVTPKGGLEAPIFITPLQNVTVQQGEKITLECFVRGAPVPEIEWRQNNGVIRESKDARTTFDGSRATLVVPEAHPMHAGSYMVIARNRAGEASSTGFVTVRTRPPPGLEGGDTLGMQAPRILPPLQSQTIVENNRLMFETKVTGEPTPEVIWYKDDAPIYPGPNIQILKDSYGWHRLVITRVTKHDSGVYLIKATNPVGEAKSLATLQVNPPPAPVTRTTQRVTEEFFESQSGSLAPGAAAPTFARPLQDVRAPFGTRARIDAVITGTPRPKVTWLFNGQPITHSTSTRQLIEIGDTYSIVIPQVGPEHLGTYTLIAENERGTAQSTGTLGSESRPPSRASPYSVSSVGKPSFTIAPRPHVEPPHFTQTLVSVVASEGEEARFEGFVTGIPPPEVVWQKDGKEIRDPSIRTSYSNGKVTLIIPRVTTDHTGKYTCSAKNEGGLATSSAQLVVTMSKEAPDFVQRLISREVMEGSSLRWEVRVSGDPPPQVTWLRNNIPIRLGADIQSYDEGRGVHVLFIRRLELSDSGQFTCKAENEAGEARSTADLIVRGKDQPPRVYYHVTRVYQQNHELGMEANRFHSGPLSDDEGTGQGGRGMGVLL